MKKSILSILLVIYAHTVNSQSINTRISYISINKDTLMLPDNEIGRIILKVWEDQKFSITKPLIVMVPEKLIRTKNYYYLINKEKKRNNINHIHTTN